MPRIVVYSKDGEHLRTVPMSRTDTAYVNNVLDGLKEMYPDSVIDLSEVTDLRSVPFTSEPALDPIDITKADDIGYAWITDEVDKEVGILLPCYVVDGITVMIYLNHVPAAVQRGRILTFDFGSDANGNWAWRCDDYPGVVISDFVHVQSGDFFIKVSLPLEEVPF